MDSVYFKRKLKCGSLIKTEAWKTSGVDDRGSGVMLGLYLSEANRDRVQLPEPIPTTVSQLP